MIPEQLDAIQARADAASKGPWHIDGGPDEAKNVITYTSGGGIIVGTYIADMVEHDEDAEFIAAARTDVPALLAYARDLEARIGRVEKVRRELFEFSKDGSLTLGQCAAYRDSSRAINAALTATEGQA